MKGIAAILLVLLGLHGARASREANLPDPAAFMKTVRDVARLDYEIQSEFTYLERRRDIRLSKLGKVTVGPLRTFEVYPSPIRGRTYKRLIAVDGQPLDPAELARRDAERARVLREAEEKRRNETPGAREARLQEEAEERREREAVLDDALAVFEVKFLRREVIEGQPLLIGTATPRPHVRVSTREGRWLKQFAGEIRVSETDHQIVRLDMRALDDVSIGWGIVGRVHKGSRFVFARRKIENAWLPSEVTFDATGRTLLFRRFHIATTTTFSDYQRADPGDRAGRGR
ncbi:MAG TPA: hypothetical protein VE379_09320 [Vicinamibacterales bacterium]|jgi:hypothetical protein|nr:hypothetical protein [Vicinamibacterales bacterium]